MTIQKDKVLHFIACMTAAGYVVLVMVLIGADVKSTCVAAFVSAVLLGVGKEYGDYMNPQSRWDNYNLLADALGAAVGASAGLIGLLAQ